MRNRNIRFARKRHGGLARRPIERNSPVPRLFIIFGKLIALAFFGVDMHHNRVVYVLNAFENIDKRSDVVAFGFVNVIQTDGFKHIKFALSVAFAQSFKVFINSAVSFGNGLLIIVNHDYHIRVEFGNRIEALERFPARKRAVAYNRDYILASADKVACLCQARSQRNRGGRMTHVKKVVFAFFGIGVTRIVFKMLVADIPRFSAG